MFGVEKAVVGVFVASEADGREVVVIDPDTGGFVNIDKVLALRSAVEL